jgi:hypothetical protein
MAQQTAVEWLVRMLYSPVCKGFIEGRTQIPFHIIEQAKAMEKEQIKDAWIATDNELQRLAAEQYYNETYNLHKNTP